MRLPMPADMIAPLHMVADRLPRARGRRRRRVWTGNGRAHIEVRGAHAEGAAAFLGRVASELSALGGVHRAEVNAVLGRVVVAFDDDALGVDDLVAVVAGVEEAHQLHEQPFPLHLPEHPADVEPVRRQVLALGADAAGIAVGLFGRLLRATPLSVEAAALVSLVDATPRLRQELENRLGAPAADLGLAVGNALGQALAQGPLGLGVDALHRVGLTREAAARRAVWLRREPELHSVGTTRPPGTSGSAPPVDRPVPLPPGPVEQYADRAAAVGLAAAGVALVITRQPRRAVTALVTTTPRAARLTREAFAAGVGRAAAGRGVLPLDPQVFRRLDRVDTVVLDAAVLTTGRFTLGPLVPVQSPPDRAAAERLALTAGTLFAPDAPTRVARDAPWSLRPAAGVPAVRRGRARTLAAALHGPGCTVLALLRGDDLVALAATVPELDPLAEALAGCARAAGAFIVAGIGSGVGERLGAVQTVPGGPRLAGAVRDLQRAGRVVAVVSAQGAALAAADCGVGVLRGHAPPWGAHLLGGAGLADACLVLEATAAARRVSRRGVQLALYGSLAGGLLALAGPPGGATSRALAAGNVAALTGIAVGTWSAATVTRRPPPLPADRTPWHALPAEQALQRLASSPEGLPAAEADRRRRQQPPAEDSAPIGVAQATVEELANPLTPALATGAGMSAASGSVADAALIGTVMGVNAVLGGVQRVGAQRALRRLEDVSAVRVRLRRNGQETLVTADTLVPGDIIVLHAGDAVPADCRVLEASGVEVDESSLTGESQLVAKAADPTAAADLADRSSMLYAGTVVAAGSAVAAVVAAGALTEAGRSARVGIGERRATGAQARLRSLTKVTIPVALGAAGALVGGGLLRNAPLRATLGTGVGLAVAAVPEGLPLVATVAQLSAARRLSRRNALVRNPATIEALGRVDVLCFDKTGTLTEGRIRLHRVSDGRADCPVDALQPAARTVLAAAVRASPEHPETGTLPHPTDHAVVVGAAAVDVTADEGADGWRVVDELPFEPSRGYHAVQGHPTTGPRLAVKGAPEIVLPRCATWRTPQGRVRLDGPRRREVEAEVDRLARRGYRVLAVAERAASGRADLDDGRVDRLELLGLVALADPVRPAAAAAVRDLRAAGVDVVMITGDHPSTAASIAADLDVLNGRGVATGGELDGMSDDALADLLPKVSVFARVSPTHKVRIVRALQRAGRVVAVTGDGANDAPAIRLADVGVALGLRGTNAAREAADVVVTDDRLETITDAIVEGRAMWSSVRDAIAVLLGGNLGEIAFTLGSALLLPAGSPLNTRQLLLVNLLTDMLPSMALAVRPPQSRSPTTLLHEGPDVSLGAALTRDVLVRGGATATAAVVGWTAGRLSGTRGQAGTVALVALVGAQLAQTLVAGWRSPLVVGASLASGAALAAVVQTPGVSHFFGCRPLTPLGWAAGVGAAVLSTAGAAIVPPLLDRLAAPSVSQLTSAPAAGGTIGSPRPLPGPGPLGRGGIGVPCS